MSFLPDEYKAPISNYLKFIEGENTFRILGNAIVGYEYWNTKNKPVRSKEPFEDVPADIQMDKEGKFRIAHFWAFPVWSYENNKVQILELTQKKVMDTIKSYVDNPKWGSPLEYDFIVSKKGSLLNTEYSTTVNPKSPMPEETKNAKLPNLEAFFSGNDPFTTSAK